LPLWAAGSSGESVAVAETEEIEKKPFLRRRRTDLEILGWEGGRIVMGPWIDEVRIVVGRLQMHAELICGEGKAREVGLGLHEIIVNAIEHGSLGISFKEKRLALENNTYVELLRQRLSDPFYSRRQVTIDCRTEPGELHYTVRDEGGGFDWRNPPCPDPRENLLSPCGRGLFLARIYLDRVEFNERGNEVHLVKYVERDGGRDETTAEGEQ